MKITLGPENCLYPSLTVLVGANVDGKPTYLAIAWIGIMDTRIISVSSSANHHTNKGIKENKTFSVNIPSVDLVKETDYCGIVSGKHVDKGALFDNFYGKLGTAPMIKGCPIDMECRLMQTLEVPGSQEVFIGEIVETHCDEECLTEGRVDIARLRPFLFGIYDDAYWSVGENFAKAFVAGKDLKGLEC